MLMVMGLAVVVAAELVFVLGDLLWGINSVHMINSGDRASSYYGAGGDDVATMVMGLGC